MLTIPRRGRGALACWGPISAFVILGLSTGCSSSPSGHDLGTVDGVTVRASVSGDPTRPDVSLTTSGALGGVCNSLVRSVSPTVTLCSDGSAAGSVYAIAVPRSATTVNARVGDALTTFRVLQTPPSWTFAVAVHVAPDAGPEVLTGVDAQAS